MNRMSIAKLAVPRAQHMVRRPRVLEAIEGALQGGICWIAAPAGYGKTIAMADYLKARGTRHVWYRVDDGDQDIAGFFHYLCMSLGPGAARALPSFGPEYADQLQAFARRFFRVYFTKLRPGTLVVLDDLHYADTPAFRTTLAVMLRELPDSIGCLCLSRTLPNAELEEFALSGRMHVIDQSVLEFSEDEARELVSKRVSNMNQIDIATAQGWALGLMLLSQPGLSPPLLSQSSNGTHYRERLLDELGRHLFDSLPTDEQQMLLQLSLLPEITIELATALVGAREAESLLTRMHQRQLLITRENTSQILFQLHDLLRDFLRDRLECRTNADQLAQLRSKVASLLDARGRHDDAIELALQGKAWALARTWIDRRAESLLNQGRCSTLNDWCAKFPDDELDGWTCYWLGVANIGDDQIAEPWFSRAWAMFSAQQDARGRCLTAVRAVQAKTDGWRTHHGLAVWTQRALDLVDVSLPALQGDEELLVLAGLVRAVDFAEHYRCDTPSAQALTQRLLLRLKQPRGIDSATLRLHASEALIEQAGSMGRSDVFEQAVDSVAHDLRDPGSSPWARGMWLVAFGSVSGRYFPYAKRGFPYASAEAALRAAIEIGETASLRGVEFGGLYHLQLQLKLRNEMVEFEAVVSRLREIADSRFSTQYAVVADCEASLHTLQGRAMQALDVCARFLPVVETNDPPVERWPHYATYYQALIAAGQCRQAVAFLESKLCLYDGGVRQRIGACITLARAVHARQVDNSKTLPLLSTALPELRSINWMAAFSNLPQLLSQLCADALQAGIETDFCRLLIQRRNLTPPLSLPDQWPWQLKIHVLGEFRLEREGLLRDMNGKPPARPLDILRMLAAADNHTCTLDEVCDRLWPDADGDKARAACDQALHRLRKLLNSPDCVLQREGKLRLSAEKVWVDLDHWEQQLKLAMWGDAKEMERSFFAFPGPLLQHERFAEWIPLAAERVKSKLTDLAVRLGRQLEVDGQDEHAQAVYLRALDFYPKATRLYEAQIRFRLARNDRAGAIEVCQRVRNVSPESLPALRKLITPLLEEA